MADENITNNSAGQPAPVTPAAPELKKKNILFFLPISNSGKELKAKLEKDSDYEVLEAGSGPEAIQVLKMAGPMVVIFQPQKKEDYIKQQSFMKIASELMKRGMIRPMLLYNRIDDSVLKTYNKLGLREMIREPVSYKGFIMKVNRLVQTLAGQKEATTEESERNLKDRTKSLKRNEQAKTEERKGGAIYKFGPPVEFASDCWVLENRKPIFAMGKWVIKYRGPAPQVGRWVELTDHKLEKKGNDPVWKWEPLNPVNDNFVKDKGTWVVRGKRPEYPEGLWIFVATYLEFFFLNEAGEPEQLKIAIMKDKDIQVAADSKAGIAMLPAIHDSLKQVLKQKGLSHIMEDPNAIRKNKEREARLEELRKQRPQLFRAEREALVSFGFILAELMCLSHLSKNQIRDRILSFIDKEMQGKRMEIWVKGGSQNWKAIGASDRKDCEAAMLLNHADKEVQIFDETTLITKLQADAQTEGALVIRGHQLDELPEQFVKDFVLLFRGIFLSFNNLAEIKPTPDPAVDTKNSSAAS